MYRALLVSVALGMAPDALFSVQTPRADTIYALAVDPADYEAYESIILLEDAGLQIDRSGSSRSTVRSVAQVLKQGGVEAWGQWSLRYRPDRERLRLNWVRVLRPDGTVVSERPAVDHESREAVDENSVYSGLMVRQLTLSGVSPGTIVDVSYTVETFRPTLPGDIYQRWFLNKMVPVRRQRYVIDAPSDRSIRIRTRNLGSEATASTRSGRTVHTWLGQDVPAIELEHFAGFPNTVYQQITVTGWLEWSAVGDWFAGLTENRDRAGPAVERAFREVAGGTREVDSLLRAAQRWIAQDFRYVSVGLGDGNYQPRQPAQVVQSRFGDCKDKVMLFVALARSWGVQAYPLLLNSAGLRDSAPVSLERFDHAIVAVEHDGNFTYLDLTNDLLPYGHLPKPLQGSYGLLVRAGGQSEMIRLPETATEENRLETMIAGTIGADARFDGRFEITAFGTPEPWLRHKLRGLAQADDKTLLDTAHDMVALYLDDPVVDSTTLNDGLSLNDDAYMYVEFTSDRMVEQSGPRFLLNLPDPFIDARTTLANLGEEARRFPIDAEELNDASVLRVTMELVLPPGWRAELPPSVSVNGLFGSYRASYTQKGRTLRIERELSGRRGLEPPDSIEVLRAWLRAIAEDRARTILLDSAGGTPPDEAGLFTAPTADTTTVALRFDWPPGLEMDVESEWRRIVEEAGTVDTQDSRTQYRLRVREHPDGRLIAYSGWDGSPIPAAELAELAGRMGPEELSSQVRPDLVVGPEGAMIRIEGFEPTRQMLDSLVRRQLRSSPNPVLPRSLVRQLLSKRFILARQQEHWNSLVGAWNGTDVAVGAVYERNVSLAAPLVDEVVPFRIESSLISRVPCQEGLVDSACVLLVIRQRPDQSVLMPMVARLIRKTLPLPDSTIARWQMDATTVYRLVTEPATMRPHRMDIEQTILLTGPDTAGAPLSLGHQSTLRRFTFRHPGGMRLPVVDSRVLLPGTDTFAVFHISGGDTTRTGTVTDQLRVDGDRLTRIWVSQTTGGGYVDSAVARVGDFAPVSVSYNDKEVSVFIAFDSTGAHRTVITGSDTVTRHHGVPPVFHIGDIFDVVVRASALSDTMRLATPIFHLVERGGFAEGRVIRSEVVKGRDCWVFSGRNGTFRVTFWVDKATRKLRRSLIEYQSGGGLLLVAGL